MLYGVANEPLNLTTAPLPSVQVRFAPIFKNFTQNHANTLAPDLLQTTKNLPRTLPRTRFKKNTKYRGIRTKPLKILPWTCPRLSPGHRHPHRFCLFRSFFETRPAASQILCKGCQLQRLQMIVYKLLCSIKSKQTMI